MTALFISLFLIVASSGCIFRSEALRPPFRAYIKLVNQSGLPLKNPGLSGVKEVIYSRITPVDIIIVEEKDMADFVLVVDLAFGPAPDALIEIEVLGPHAEAAIVQDVKLFDALVSFPNAGPGLRSFRNSLAGLNPQNPK